MNKQKLSFIELHKSIQIAILKTLEICEQQPDEVFNYYGLLSNFEESSEINMIDVHYALCSLIKDQYVRACVSSSSRGESEYSSDVTLSCDDPNLFEIEISDITKLWVSTTCPEFKEFVSNENQNKILECDNTHDVAFIVEDIYQEYQVLKPIRHDERIAEKKIQFSDIQKSMALAEIDKLLDMVRSSNIAKMRGNEQLERSVRDIELGMEEIKKGKSTVGRIESLFYGSLAYIVTSFADVPIGQVAETTWKVVAKMVQAAI